MTLDLNILFGGLQPASSEDARRLFHGRGHAYPGFEELNLDFYPPVLVIQLYREGYPLAELARRLREHLQEVPLSCILAQHRYRREGMWEVLWGEAPECPAALENGLSYGLTFMKNQNVGFFPDMRPGRALAAALAPGRRVLNLFAYTCSFSVAAMAAGAASCCNMDLSKAALAVGRANHRRNGIDTSSVRFLGMDVLKSFGRLKRDGPFDLVVIDPPSHQDGFNATRDYARIVRRLPEFLSPGGEVLACLNDPFLPPAFLDELFADYQWQATLGRPPEYVESQPERGLKIGHYRAGG